MNFYCDAIIFNHPSFNGILYISMLIISDDTSKYKVKIGYSSSPLYSSFIFGIYLHSLDSQPIIIHFKQRFLDQTISLATQNYRCINFILDSGGRQERVVFTFVTFYIQVMYYGFLLICMCLRCCAVHHLIALTQNVD